MPRRLRRPRQDVRTSDRATFSLSASDPRRSLGSVLSCEEPPPAVSGVQGAKAERPVEGIAGRVTLAVPEQRPADAAVVAREGRLEAVAADGLDGGLILAPQALQGVHQLAARAEVVGRDALAVTAVAEDDPVEVADPRPGEEP